MPPKLYPRLLLAVLTGLNILNYIDRNVLFAVQSDVKKEFLVSDAKIGILTSAFFFTYMFAAPVVGWMGDRFPRKNIVVFGIFIWSGFTFFTWLVHDYNQLLFRHAIVGIGEASYATIAPTLIADSFPPLKRGRMLSIFFLGLPVGSAAGYFVGGYVAQYFGSWRAPFMAAGIPGFLLALLLWMLPEPPRGQHEEHAPVDVRTLLKGLLRNGAFLTATFGMAAYTFAMGGMQVWIPTFLVRLRGLDLKAANIDFSIIVIINGIGATLLGGWIGDRLLKRYLRRVLCVFRHRHADCCAVHGGRDLCRGAADVSSHVCRRIFYPDRHRPHQRRAGQLGKRQHPLHCAGGQRLHHPSPGRRFFSHFDRHVSLTRRARSRSLSGWPLPPPHSLALSFFMAQSLLRVSILEKHDRI